MQWLYYPQHKDMIYDSMIIKIIKTQDSSSTRAGFLKHHKNCQQVTQYICDVVVKFITAQAKHTFHKQYTVGLALTIV